MFNSKIGFILLILVLEAAALFANPFIKPHDEKRPESVRPPAFSASAGLIDAQLRFREAIADFFAAWRDEKRAGAILSLAAAGFIYGVLHALGPGHRKTVMFSLFIARKARFHEPLLAGFLSALLHGMSAVFIILCFRSLSNRLLIDKVNLTAIYLEGFTYLLLALLAAVLMIVELAGHKEEQQGKNRSLYGTIALTSIFPCPAAIMILIFSLSLELFPLGILTVGSLSLGMGITISLIGYLAWGGRESLFRRFQGKEKTVTLISHILEGISYSFLILFSLWMALPFLVSLPKLL